MREPEFVDDHVMLIGDVRFHYEHPLNAVPNGHLGIEKLRPLLQAYVDLWADIAPRHVVELGIRRGGSTAMLCELGGLERIVSIELSDRASGRSTGTSPSTVSRTSCTPGTGWTRRTGRGWRRS